MTKCLIYLSELNPLLQFISSHYSISSCSHSHIAFPFGGQHSPFHCQWPILAKCIQIRAGLSDMTPRSAWVQPLRPRPPKSSCTLLTDLWHLYFFFAVLSGYVFLSLRLLCFLPDFSLLLLLLLLFFWQRVVCFLPLHLELDCVNLVNVLTFSQLKRHRVFALRLVTFWAGVWGDRARLFH